MTEVVKRGSLEPWIKDDIKYLKHQVEGIRWGAKRRSFILADDMGLGKSLEALTIFGIDVARGWGESAIIISPPSLKGNWADELNKFTRFPYVVLDGTPDERVVQLFKYMCMEGPRILIVNYEQVAIHKQALDNIAFDVAIYDEAHYIKNPFAQRSKAVLEIRSRRSFMLTGTPMLNRIDELWAILHRVDPDKYGLYYSFVNRFGVFGGYKDKQLVGVKNEQELRERVQSVMLRRLKKDVLDLPDVQIIERRVDLHPAQRALYDEVSDNLNLPRLDADDEEIGNALTKFLRLKQICGTTLPFNGEDVSAKLDAATLEDTTLLENGEKVVVFTQFRDVQNCYIARMKKLDVPIFSINGDTPHLQRPATAKVWSAVEGPAIFVAMLQVAAEGLNLTASRHGSFLDKLYTPGKNRQSVDRLHRIGQSTTQPVQIREYLARNSVDNRIQQINRMKQKQADDIIDTDPDWKRKLLKLLMETSDD